MDITDKIIDTKKIAEILGFASSTVAAHLCSSGKLVTARKMGNAWVAELEEVLGYKAQMMARGKKRGPNKDLRVGPDKSRPSS